MVMKYSCLFVLAVIGVFAATSEAYGQWIIPNSFGTNSFIYPSRMSPWARPASPVFENQFTGDRFWIGEDGMPHGDVTDPNTGDTHHYSNTQNLPTQGVRPNMASSSRPAFGGGMQPRRFPSPRDVQIPRHRLPTLGVPHTRR
jgi:hypothetical protein